MIYPLSVITHGSVPAELSTGEALQLLRTPSNASRLTAGGRQYLCVVNGFGPAKSPAPSQPDCSPPVTFRQAIGDTTFTTAPFTTALERSVRGS